METLGQRIKRRRLELGLTQRELAERIGWPTPTDESNSSSRMSHYENDTRKPKLDDLISLSKALDVDPSYLISNVERVRFPVYGGRKEESANDRPEIRYREPVQLAQLGLTGIKALENSAFYLSRQWIEENGFKLSQLRFHRIKDRSQEPLATVGDNLVINIADKNAIDRKMYAIQYNDAVKLRTLKTSLSGAIVLIDSHGDEETIDSDTWKTVAIGRVVAKFTLI